MAAMGIPKTRISRISGFSVKRVNKVLQTEAPPKYLSRVRIADYADVPLHFAASAYGSRQWEEGEKEGKEEDALGMAALGFSEDEIASVTGFTAEKVKTVLQTGA